MSINWNTTLEKVKLEVLLNMYATRDYDPDTIKFDKEIADMDAERALLNNQKTTALFDGDSAPVCKGGDEKDARASHPEERCDNTLEDTIYLPKSKKLELYVMSQAKKGMEAITWSEISEAIEDDPKLKKILNALRDGDDETVTKEITGVKLLDTWADQSEIENTQSKVNIEELSL